MASPSRCPSLTSSPATKRKRTGPLYTSSLIAPPTTMCTFWSYFSSLVMWARASIIRPSSSSSTAALSLLCLLLRSSAASVAPTFPLEWLKRSCAEVTKIPAKMMASARRPSMGDLAISTHQHPRHTSDLSMAWWYFTCILLSVFMSLTKKVCRSFFVSRSG